MLSEALFARLKLIISSVNGEMGICIIDLETGGEMGFNPDLLLPMASVCKVPILVTAYRMVEAGLLDIAERVEITEPTRCFGSGLFNTFDIGLLPTLHDLLLMMIVVSDNAATDLVLSKTSVGKVTQTMQELGLRDIHVDRTIAALLSDFFVALEPGLADMRYGEWDSYCDKFVGLRERSHDAKIVREAVNLSTAGRDVASAKHIARLLGQIATGDCASRDSCDAMLQILGRQVLNGRLPRALPPFTRFPHKTGTLGVGAVVNDAGVLFLNDRPVAAIAVLSRDLKDPVQVTESNMAEIGRAVYDSFATNEPV